MATITRTQHFHIDPAAHLMAVQGSGTDKFQASGQPKTCKSNFGRVFTGRVRVTKSETSRGYFFLLLDAKRGTESKRVFFRGDAKVSTAGMVVTVDAYYRALGIMEDVLNLG